MRDLSFHVDTCFIQISHPNLELWVASVGSYLKHTVTLFKISGVEDESERYNSPGSKPNDRHEYIMAI